MTIGEKIKSIRLSKGMTQTDVAGEKITRNMLSAIENGKTSPSLESILHIAERLGICAGYLISDNINPDLYRKEQLLSFVKPLLQNGNYQECIKLTAQISVIDDELAYILAKCYFEEGRSAAKRGSFVSASEMFSQSLKYCSETIYDTARYEMLIPLYNSFVKNINSPLLEFDSSEYLSRLQNETEYEFYKYLTNDISYDFSHPFLKLHMAAKAKIKERKYTEAIEMLLQLESMRHKYDYNVYLMFCVYSDLDNCYKQICDFESAYRYSSKRLSLLEGFNS